MLPEAEDALDIAVELLPEEAFYVEAHQRVYRAILSLNRMGRKVDILTVTEQLISTGDLDAVGGALFLTKLQNDVTSTASVEVHCRIVLEKYMAREIIRAGSHLLSQGYSDSVDVFDLLDDANDQITRISNSIIRKDATHISTELVNVARQIEARRNINDFQILRAYIEFSSLTGYDML